MRRATPWIILGAMLLLAAGCSGGTAETTVVSETTVPGATTVTTAATTTTTAGPVVAADASCVECHTDQAALQVLAVEPVEEVLSEGEG